MSELLVKPAVQANESNEVLVISQQSAGWETISIRVVKLNQGQKILHTSPKEELVLVSLSGVFSVKADGQSWEKVGKRENVFSGMPHALYLPVNLDTVEIRCETESCELAICGAVAEKTFPPCLINPSDVEVEIRGAENATRQINHIVKPEFPADRILIVEVYTPSGNWSSYPPHKHDEHNPPEEVDLDEIYFYKISKPEGFAIQKVYNGDRTTDETITVRNNEAILIPDGYHPVVAAHGYDCYYLNVLAGSARSMAASDDPDYAWVRDEWEVPDPRIPMVRID
jgi:5-deoxy-glucuronate isomerase